MKYTKACSNIFYKVVNDSVAIKVTTGLFASIQMVPAQCASGTLGIDVRPASEKDFQVAYDSVREKLHELAQRPAMTNPELGAITKVRKTLDSND